ncbi:MAG: hypothetical protein ABWX70_09365 [Hyphomicrobium sp.]
MFKFQLDRPARQQRTIWPIAERLRIPYLIRHRKATATTTFLKMPTSRFMTLLVEDDALQREFCPRSSKTRISTLSIARPLKPRN